MALGLAELGVPCQLVSNASEVEGGFRQHFSPADYDYLQRRLRGGAGVTVTLTTPIGRERHIPHSSAVASRLLGAALQVAESSAPGAIIGWYMEPYGVVAACLGALLQIPVCLVHAGSDLGRLAQHRDLRGVFGRALRNAHTVYTGPRTIETVRALAGAAVRTQFRMTSRLPEWFSEYEGLALHDYSDGERSGAWGALNLPTVGVYGKIGTSKGTYDLLDALQVLTERGVEFKLLATVSGWPSDLERWNVTVQRNATLRDRTLTLPPLPPWQIPSFLKRCDVVCYLERDFPIAFHTPVIPREVLSTGRCLVVSKEIALKQPFAHSLSSEKNCVIVDDPSDRRSLVEALARILSSPEQREHIGAHGRCLSQYFEGTLQRHAFADQLRELFQ
jgi:glycosyltransferase involved in cell wall biosynthesis